jgi:phospholipid-binding lipoprotein MlaA
MRNSGIAALLLVSTLSACATINPGSMAQAERDPYENTNRKVYKFNRGLDRYALRPAATVYRAVIPKPARTGVTNVFNNIDEPVSFINAVLQGKVKRAFRTVDRFLLNTTLGVGGLADVATKLGRPEQPEDFGQTLAVWGVKSGPYLMLPLLGPSTLRDLGGFGVDFATDPVTYARNAALNPNFVETAGQFALETIDLRSKLMDAGADGVLKSSLDEYATVRSAFLQQRRSAIYDGVLPDEDDEPVEDAPLAPGATPPAPVPPQ